MHERPQHAKERTTSPTDIKGLDEITLDGRPTGHPPRIGGSAGCGTAVLGMTCQVRGVQCDEADVGVITIVTAERGEDQGHDRRSSVQVSEMAETGRAAKRSEEPQGTGSGP